MRGRPVRPCARTRYQPPCRNPCEVRPGCPRGVKNLSRTGLSIIGHVFSPFVPHVPSLSRDVFTPPAGQRHGARRRLTVHGGGEPRRVRVHGGEAAPRHLTAHGRETRRRTARSTTPPASAG
eukprot:4817899-Prymnesium_polylepis.2